MAKNTDKRTESTADDYAMNKNSAGEIFSSAKRIFTMIVSEYPLLVLVMAVIILTISILPIIESFIYGKLFDSLIETATGKGVTDSRLFINLGLVLAIMVLTDIAQNAYDTLDFGLRERFMVKAKAIFTRKIATLDQEHFDDSKTNDLINRAGSNYQNSIYIFFTSMLRIIEMIVTIILSVTVLFSITPILIFLTFLISVPRALINISHTKEGYKIFKTYSEKRRDSGRTAHYLTQENRVREVRTFNLIEYLSERFLKIDRAQTYEWINLMNKYFYIRAASGVLNALGFGLIVIVLTRYVSSGFITVGSLTFYVTTSNRLRNSVAALFSQITRIYERGIYVNDFFKLLDIKEKIHDGDIELDLGKVPPLIVFENVWFKYPKTKEYVIKNFNLTISPGEHLAIVGENGAGKTTLVKILMRIYDVNKGRILINGTDIKKLKLDSWYKYVGTLFQEYNFYHFDALTNIGVGDIQRLDEKDNIIEASKQAGSHEFIQKYDEGYDQLMNRSFTGGINPSTGQKQRIALARAFFRNAKLLILDEPTSSIDAKGEYEIFQRLFEFAKEKSVMIISHRFSTVRNASRIIVLDKGKIAEEGSHEELIKIQDGIYNAAFNIQKKGYE